MCLLTLQTQVQPEAIGTTHGILDKTLCLRCRLLQILRVCCIQAQAQRLLPSLSLIKIVRKPLQIPLLLMLLLQPPLLQLHLSAQACRLILIIPELLMA